MLKGIVSCRLSAKDTTLIGLLLAVYLTGATLFLAVLLTRVFAIVLDLILAQERLNTLQTSVGVFLHPRLISSLSSFLLY
jgi:hypothetical protein